MHVREPASQEDAVSFPEHILVRVGALVGKNPEWTRTENAEACFHRNPINRKQLLACDRLKVRDYSKRRAT
jgi:hypothetical protein